MPSNRYARWRRSPTSSAHDSMRSSSVESANQPATSAAASSAPMRSRKPGGRRARNSTPGARHAAIANSSWAATASTNRVPIDRSATSVSLGLSTSLRTLDLARERIRARWRSSPIPRGVRRTRSPSRRRAHHLVDQRDRARLAGLRPPHRSPDRAVLLSCRSTESFQSRDVDDVCGLGASVDLRSAKAAAEFDPRRGAGTNAHLGVSRWLQAVRDRRASRRPRIRPVGRLPDRRLARLRPPRLQLGPGFVSLSEALKPM